MKWILLVLALSGCASVPDDGLQGTLQQEASKRVAAFNALRGVNFPVPTIEVSSLGDYAETYSATSITIDRERCLKDMDDCLNDTIPHELAHAAIYWSEGITITTSIEHGRIMHTVDSPIPSHGFIWCDTMRAFGGVPEKHGYCQYNASLMYMKM